MSDFTHQAMEPPDPLYLFFCRVRCIRLGDLRAYEELQRAASNPDPDIRRVAEVFLAEARALKSQQAIPVEGVMRRLTIMCVLLAASILSFADVQQDTSDRTHKQLAAAQQLQYEQCLSAIERLDAEVGALSATPSRPEPAITIYAKHRGSIRLAATSVRKCHAAFSDSLTREQRRAMKEALTQLGHSSSEIQRHVITLDDDLNQHLLDDGRLVVHVQGFKRSIDEYLQQYRRFGD